MSAVSSTFHSPLKWSDLERTITGPETTKEDMKVLLSNPEVVRVTNRVDDTALHLAVDRKAITALSCLLEYRQYSNFDEATKLRFQAISAVLSAQKEPGYRELCMHEKFDVNKPNTHGFTPLSLVGKDITPNRFGQDLPRYSKAVEMASKLAAILIRNGASFHLTSCSVSQRLSFFGAFKALRKEEVNLCKESLKPLLKSITVLPESILDVVLLYHEAPSFAILYNGNQTTVIEALSDLEKMLATSRSSPAPSQEVLKLLKNY